MKLNKLLSRLFRYKLNNGYPKAEPYIEQFTKCDKCEKLVECRDARIVLNITMSLDKYENFIFGSSGCPMKVVDTP